MKINIKKIKFIFLIKVFTNNILIYINQKITSLKFNFLIIKMIYLFQFKNNKKNIKYVKQ